MAGATVCPKGFTAKEVSKNTLVPLNIPVPKNTCQSGNCELGWQRPVKKFAKTSRVEKTPD